MMLGLDSLIGKTYINVENQYKYKIESYSHSRENLLMSVVIKEKFVCKRRINAACALRLVLDGFWIKVI